RVAISSEQFYSVETVDGLANKAGTLEFYFKDQNAQKKYLKALNEITPKDVQKVAQKYLKLDKMSAAFLGDVDTKDSEKLLAGIKNIWKEKINSQKIKTNKKPVKKISIPRLTLKPAKLVLDEKIERIRLDSGINVLFKSSKDTPTVTAKFVFRGGARLEEPATMGLSELASRVWISDTTTKNEEQLMQELEESAIGLSAFSGKNTAGFSLEYLSAFEEKAIALTIDSILNAKFSDEVIEREKSILVQAIKSREDHPSSRCVRQFLKNMFGEHPLSYESGGTEQSLPNLSRSKIVELKNKLLSNKNLTVVVVGDYNKKLWLEALKKLEKGMGSKNEAQPAHEIKSLSENKSEFLSSDKEQSHIIVGWRGLTLTDLDRYTLHAIEAILAGQGGRLFFELRDKNSLAYSVSPMRMESLETGYFGGYIACSHEKVEKAIEMFQVEFSKLTKEKVSDEELARAKKYLIGQHDIGLQRKAAICNLIAFDEVYGNDFNQSLNVASEYNKVTQEKIIDLAKKLFTKPAVISIVGKRHE
ncbi:MAG: insulinase family protein, partial [Bdellovibrionota bacterium]